MSVRALPFLPNAHDERLKHVTKFVPPCRDGKSRPEPRTFASHYIFLLLQLLSSFTMSDDAAATAPTSAPENVNIDDVEEEESKVCVHITCVLTHAHRRSAARCHSIGDSVNEAACGRDGTRGQ
jgi:hypothetical protein